MSILSGILIGLLLLVQNTYPTPGPGRQATAFPPASSFIVQSNGNFTFAGSNVTTLTSVGSGHAIALFTYQNGGVGSSTSVSDASGNTFVYQYDSNATAFFILCNASAGTHAITNSSGANWQSSIAVEISGNPTSGCVDSAAGGVQPGGALPVTGGTATANDLIMCYWAVISGGTTWTFPSTQTQEFFVNGSFGLTSVASYNKLIQISGTAPSCTYTSGSGAGLLAAIKI